jgi:hypothetical protein
MQQSEIKSDKQIFFNQIRGVVEEILPDDRFTTVALKVGHENHRNIALVSKNDTFDKFRHILSLNNKVLVKFYISSRKKHDRWYTTATILDASIVE